MFCTTNKCDSSDSKKKKKRCFLPKRMVTKIYVTQTNKNVTKMGVIIKVYCIFPIFDLAYQGKDIIVFRFIIEYSNLRDFGP